ncbi:MAG: DsbA family protein [Janthinobacterium lividum]
MGVVLWLDAEPAARAERETDDDLLFVGRHLPLTDVHPRAQLAAEASEAAGRQDAFWTIHDLLLSHQDHLTRSDLLGYAARLGLDVERFGDDLDHHVHADRIATDIDSPTAAAWVGHLRSSSTGGATTAPQTQRHGSRALTPRARAPRR